MSRTLLLSVSVLVASLSSVVGCGANPAHHSAVPSSAHVACDESWTPPGEMKLSFETNDAARANAISAPTERLKGSYRPNSNDRPTSGAVHAAIY